MLALGFFGCPQEAVLLKAQIMAVVLKQTRAGFSK
jgi:hypothetical protein